VIDNNFAAPNNQLTFSINPKNRFVMAENSLQNQKNEVSFVLSEKAKAIIEKFEKQIENRSENDKNELRIDLLMLLLKRLHPEVLSADAKGLFAEIYRLNNRTTDKNTGFLMHCFSENELNNLSDDFNSIWSYYCSMFSIEGIPTSDDYQELLLCESLMPDGKRRLVVTFSFFTLIKKSKELDIGLEELKSQIKENQIQSKALETILAELEIRLNTLSLGLLFDRIVIPRLQTISNSDFNSFLEFIDDFVKDEGIMFFLGNPTEINKLDYQQFHKWAVDNKYLHGVIEMDDLPSYDANRQILVLSKRPTDSIFFAWIDGPMDGEGPSVKEIAKILSEKNPDNYKVISSDDFKAHNSNYYTFAKRQFVPSIIANEGETVVTLRDIVDLYESETKEDIPCFFINRGYYLEDDCQWGLEGVVMPRARRVPFDNFFLFKYDEPSESFLCSYQKYPFDDSRLDSHYSTGVDHLVDDNDDPVVCTYPDAIIFKLKANTKTPVDPYYLTKLLYSNEVRTQLECFQLPYTDISIENEDFLSIKIALPSLEEQQRIVSLDLQKALADTREEIKKNFESYKQDIRMKKHAMAQRLTVMNNWWKNLLMAREEGNGIVDDDATVGHLHPVPVRNIYTQIGHEINMLFKQLNSFNLGDAMDNKEIFDATTFVQEYVKHHDPMFEYQCALPDKPANIRFPKEAFQIILDNIASNACSHGFKERKAENIIRIRMEIKGDVLIAYVSNNGKPMPVKMTAEKVFTYGDTTEEGVGEHSGLGGYQIKDLMTKFGGEVELLLDAEAAFPVTYKLIFFQ
jgi:hypothetical protein